MALHVIETAMAAVGSECTFLSTDDGDLKSLAWDAGVGVIDRPPELCTDEALGEDAFVHGYKSLKESSFGPDILALMFCNAPTVTPDIIRDGVRVLMEREDLDSAVTVSRYNMWSPARARRIGEDGLLHAFVPLEAFADVPRVDCDRDSQGDVWFADMGVSVVRARCLENIRDGMLPQRWMGRRIWPLRQEGGLDVDFEWQIPMAEYWLRKESDKSGPNS